MTLQIPEYKSFLEDLKLRIRTSQVKAALAVNKELVLLYWSIGQDILTKQEELGWGAKVIDQLSDDLRDEFPDIKGFSKRNLKYMRAFASAYPEEEFVQQAAAQIRRRAKPRRRHAYISGFEPTARSFPGMPDAGHRPTGR